MGNVQKVRQAHGTHENAGIEKNKQGTQYPPAHLQWEVKASNIFEGVFLAD